MLFIMKTSKTFFFKFQNNNLIQKYFAILIVAFKLWKWGIKEMYSKNGTSSFSLKVYYTQGLTHNYVFKKL